MPEPVDEVNEMVQVTENNEEQLPEYSSSAPKISFMKVGIPILLIQVVIAYFLASYVLVPQLYGDASSTNPDTPAARPSERTQQQETDAENFGAIYSVKDVVVNPAGSQGMQFILVNFGFEVKEDSDANILEKREVQVRDILIKILGSKTIDELDDPADKEMLRQEIKEKLDDLLSPGHLMNVYFSNFIIQ